MVYEAVFKCAECGSVFEPYAGYIACPKCGSILIPIHRKVDSLKVSKKYGVWVWERYIIKLRPKGKNITLGEGSTPLIKSEGLSRHLGIRELWLKDESRNPTGTFIDRGSAVAISMAVTLGFKGVTVASSGDFGISVAAYARRSGIKSKVYVPSTVEPSKAYQTILLSNKVVMVSDYDEAVDAALKAGKGIYMPVIPSSPYILEGYRTVGYELMYQLGKSPDYIIVPVGDGALLSMIWLSINEIIKDSDVKPKVIGVRGSTDTPLLKDISMKKPLLQKIVNDVIEESSGSIVEVYEEEVLEATRLLAVNEGIIAEPVGASAIAGLMKIKSQINSNSSIVAIITGAAIKDPATLRLLIKEADLDVLPKLGFTKWKILEILSVEGPAHPYAIWKLLIQKYSLRIGLRTVYQHIEELERLNLIKVESVEKVSGRMRKLYCVTKSGMKLLGK
jgi:threonine synthase